MRQIDEILWSFSSQPPPAQRYLLRRLERQPITADAPLLRAKLKQLIGPDLRDSARLVQDDLFNRSIRTGMRRIGGGAGESGQWTLFYGGEGGGKAPTQTDGADLERAAIEDMVPLVRALESRLDDEHLEDSLEVLSRIRVPSALDLIAQAGREAKHAAACVAALANLGGENASERALELVRGADGGPEHPAMVSNLRLLPSPEVRAYLEQLIGRTPEHREAVAIALEGFPAEQANEILEGIFAFREPWPVIQCIETMGRIGGDGLAGRLSKIFHALAHPLVRVVCLQAVGESRDRDAAELVATGMRTPDPLVQAAAVEALINLPFSDSTPLEAVSTLVDSPHPKLAMNATLACALLEPPRAIQRVRQFLSSPSPQDLLKGIHCLSYLNYPPAAAILASIVRKAPRGPMRLQALRALGRRASRSADAVPELHAFLAHEDAEVRRLAACFAGDTHPVTREQAAAALTAHLGEEQDDQAAALMAQSLGTLALESGDGPAVLARLTRERGPPVSHAAGRALAWGFPEHPAAEALGSLEDPVLVALEAFRVWSLGEGPPEGLAQVIRDSEGADFTDVCGVAGELCEAAVVSPEAPRLAGLVQRLQLVAAGEKAPTTSAASLLDSQLGVRTETLPQVDGEAEESTETQPKLDADDLHELTGFLTSDLSSLARSPPGAPSPGSGEEWWSGKSRPSRERPVTQVRVKGVARSADGQGDFTAEDADQAMRSVFKAPAEEFERALDRVNYFAGAARAEAEGLDPRIKAVAAGGLLALGLIATVLGRNGEPPLPPPSPASQPSAASPRPGAPPTTPRAGPVRGHQAKIQSAEEEVLRQTQALATQPTTEQSFEDRWRGLRKWVALEPERSQSICSYTDLMKLRFRKLQGDDAALTQLDGWLAEAREAIDLIRADQILVEDQ